MKHVLSLLAFMLLPAWAQAQQILTDDVPQPPSTGGSFSKKCANPDVIFCQDFESVTLAQGANKVEGVFINGSAQDNRTAVMPAVVDVNGNKFLRFTILNQSGPADAGQYYVDFGRMDRPVGPGESLYVQWQQWLPASFVSQRFAARKGKRTSPKMLILDRSSAASCPDRQIHLVVVRGNWSDTEIGDHIKTGLAAYTKCPSSVTIETAGPKVNGSRVWDTQPTNDDWKLSRRCWKGNRVSCVELHPDTVSTFQVGLEIDAEKDKSSSGKQRWNARFRLWQDSELVMDKIIGLSNMDQLLGRAWFLPYMTNKDDTQVHPDTWTAIDNIVISREPISQ